MNRPLETVARIGNKLIRDTPFTYQLELAPNHGVFDRMHVVDFGRTFGLGRPAVAYAWTQLSVPRARTLTVHIEHNDGCQICLNGQVVHRLAGPRPIRLRRDERSFETNHAFQMSLRAGVNTLLIKSETRGTEWRVYLQPPSAKGAVENGAIHPEIGLRGAAHVDPAIATLTNWLLIGPFTDPNGDLDAKHAPEHEFVFGRIYPGLDGPVTWTIPKVEILGGLVDPLPWGTNYNWNYHNGGTAWAMQVLSEATGDRRYADYANRFCDFHLGGIPFVEYQVKVLNAVESANHWIVDTPLLDFTLAPSLPFIYRLRTESEFAHRPAYEHWVARMLDYARHGQIRLPGHGIYTRTTPREYTTWTDDMFMGIPFLVQAALYERDEVLQQAFLEDAARQVLEFNTQVWDEEARLYRHARYFGDPAKLPHWSRCNGWAIWALSEVLLHLPGDHPKRAAVLEQFRTHASSLARLQDTSGFWFNVLDRPDSSREVSGTAIFAMAMARGIRKGWLDADVFRSVAEKGWNALETQVERDGTVHGICMGTMCTEDVEYYVNRPFYDNDTHGLFAVLFAGIEMDRLRHPPFGILEHRFEDRRLTRPRPTLA